MSKDIQDPAEEYQWHQPQDAMQGKLSDSSYSKSNRFIFLRCALLCGVLAAITWYLHLVLLAGSALIGYAALGYTIAMLFALLGFLVSFMRREAPLSHDVSYKLASLPCLQANNHQGNESSLFVWPSLTANLLFLTVEGVFGTLNRELMHVSCHVRSEEAMIGKTLEMVQFVLRYATYALEDAQSDFKRDVMENDGWTQEEADAGYEMLGKIIASLGCYRSIVNDEPSLGG